MKLVASMIVKNEADRYLRMVVDHLLEFCDEIRVWDDGSTDSFREVLDDGPWSDERLKVMRSSESVFFRHEGNARQQLLEWTLEANPSHVLAIDADEFVTDGKQLRTLCETQPRVPVWNLKMEEIWEADEEGLSVRVDGGWRPHEAPLLYAVPSSRNRTQWRIQNKALACGREPIAVGRQRSRARPAGVEILHFGWACAADRRERYQRYVTHDGGRFHRNEHLNSIMWGADKVRLQRRSWPSALAALSREISARAQRAAAPEPPKRFPLSLEDMPAFVPGIQHESAYYAHHPDGRWLEISWDGVVRTGTDA